MDEYLSDSEGDRESEEELSEVEQANAIVVETVSDSSSEEDEGSQVMVRRQPTVVEKHFTHFDKSLAATHSYMGRELIPLSGHAPLEAGWRGRLPVAAHTGAVFPGETVPMLLPDPDDATILSTTIQNDKLFGLLCPDATGALVSGYGVLCEVYEAGARRTAVTFKARARHRFRLLDMPRRPVPLHDYIRMQLAEVCVLPELRPAPPLQQARLASLDGLRASPAARRVCGMDAALTPWPSFVHQLLDYRRARDQLCAYFSSLDVGQLPEEPVALSFWVASNLMLSARDRLALFKVDDALLRLHMELRFIAGRSSLCCTSCGAQIAWREDVLPMSSEGVHSNYTNSGGYMHDIVTVSRAGGVQPRGQRSAEFSWFPGYTWHVLECAACSAHLGWRFEALSPDLRPAEFYGLCRNNVQPDAHYEDDHV